MTEKLLQYIWQFQYFNKKELRTTEGEQLEIIHQGQLNRNQGPDFLEARIAIGARLWAGSVELHLRSSGWHNHRHADDPNYRNVVLHVVWVHDRNYMGIPTLILADRVSKMLLLQYEMWMNSRMFIPCGQFSFRVRELVLNKWKERLLAERMERKYGQVLVMLQHTRFHWEEVLWWLLARSFGLPVNAEAFEELARSVPLNVVLKHRVHLNQIEAILLGQARMIKEGDGELMKEYQFYARKYRLKPINIGVQLLRMRPSSFPLNRLKHLALLYNREGVMMDKILAGDNRKSIKKIFPANVIINAVIPILYAYGREHSEFRFVEKAFDLFHCVSKEINVVTRAFEKLGLPARTAGDSQALLELKSQYCDKRKCLECSIGAEQLSRQ